MSSKAIVATALITGVITVALSACDNNNNNGRNNFAPFAAAGVTINVEGAIAEGGDGGDGGNAANQGGQIAQDGSAAVDVEVAGAAEAI
jgi:hypothetical protein